MIKSADRWRNWASSAKILIQDAWTAGRLNPGLGMINTCHRALLTFPDDTQCPKEPRKPVICSDLWYCLHFLGIVP